MGLRSTYGWLLGVCVLGAGVLVAWLLAGEPPKPMPAVTWAGAQIERANGGTRLRFTQKRPPRIRIAGPVSAPVLALRRDGETRVIPMQSDTLDGLVAWVADPPPIEPGPAELVLRADGYAPAELAVEWGAIPTRKVAPDAIPSLPALEQSGAWREVARAQARKGDLDSSVKSWLAAADAADAAGQLSETARFRRAAVHQLIQLGRIEEARVQLALAEARSTEIEDTRGLSLAALYRARLARSRGDVRQSERHYANAAKLAARSGERRFYDMFRILGAVELQYAGRHADAISRLESIAAEPTRRGPVEQAELYGNEAWVRLRAAAQNAVPLPEKGLLNRFNSARDYFLEQGAIALAANVEENLAMMHLLRGNLQAAREQLDVRRARQVPGNDLWFVDLLDARIALATSDLARAQLAFEGVATAKDAPPEYRWRALFGLGQIATAQNRRDVARDKFELALQGLAAQARLTAIDTSRASFFADHRALVEAAFDLAVEDGRLTDAFAIVDADRARITRALDLGRHLQRMDADARADFLRERARFEGGRRDGELQADPTAWQAERAQTATALRQRFDALVSASQVPDPEPKLSQLAPDERIVSVWRQGESQHVLLAGPAGVEIVADWQQSLPKEGHLYVVDSPDAEALIQHAPAAWTVSLIPYAGWLAINRTAAPAAAPVVLGDPDGTLPAAHAEAEAVAKTLAVRPLNRSKARPQTVLQLMNGTRVFHFAGHGVLTAQDPFAAHLRLADRTRLGLADVLVARPRLGLAVLSGCDTGTRGTLAGEHSVGLAQAFLIAGADRVLAANTPVPDNETRRFMQAFYAAGGAQTPGAALRATQPSGGPWRMWGRR